MAHYGMVGELDRFLTERGDPLMRTAVLLTGSREAGQDLLQTALERLLRHWRTLEGDPEAYLRRTVADGDFGPMTQAAVVCWQSEHGLANDGIVGPVTWHAMQVSLRKGPADGQWQYYSSYSNPAANNFLQWTPSGAWYTMNNAGKFVRM
jgi:peptidoglycan hydrolase-like protein with peptidoglycan-binding domain